MVQSAGEFLATDVVLAGILVIALIAFVLELGLRALQRRLTPGMEKDNEPQADRFPSPPFLLVSGLHAPRHGARP